MNTPLSTLRNTGQRETALYPRASDRRSHIFAVVDYRGVKIL